MEEMTRGFVKACDIIEINVQNEKCEISDDGRAIGRFRFSMMVLNLRSIGHIGEPRTFLYLSLLTVVHSHADGTITY